MLCRVLRRAYLPLRCAFCFLIYLIFFPFGGRCLIVYLIVFEAPMVNVFDFTRDLV
jgi:hypothetical protein